MNGIDLTVLLITILILSIAAIVIVYKIIKKRFGCSSCPAVKQYKKDIKKAHKQIKKDKNC